MCTSDFVNINKSDPSPCHVVFLAVVLRVQHAAQCFYTYSAICLVQSEQGCGVEANKLLTVFGILQCENPR